MARSSETGSISLSESDNAQSSSRNWLFETHSCSLSSLEPLATLAAFFASYTPVPVNEGSNENATDSVQERDRIVIVSQTSKNGQDNQNDDESIQAEA
jgi:hypothetical protein